MPNLTLLFSENDIYNLNVEQLKNQIHENHPFKPSIKNQKLLYGGKVLKNED